MNSLLEANKDFLKKEELYKVNWSENQNIVRKFYSNLIKSDFFNRYLDKGDTSLEDDKKLYIQIVDHLFTEEELLKDFYEEKSVYYVDGYDLVILLLIKFFETINKHFDEDAIVQGLFKSVDQRSNEDLDFVMKLYKKTILRDEENNEILKQKTSSWDYNRIPLMDIILLKMALIELQEMETVPVKVTLNEYIELTKYFSSAKSRTFVNGVLDRLIKEFKEAGKIKKVGRGLID